MTLLHHGSYTRIERIDLSLSKSGKDFGKGFYLNPDYEQAMLWAKSRVKTYETGEATVTSYEFNLEQAISDGVKVKIFDDYTEEWADFVVANRRNSSDNPTHSYDIVIGPIADDNVGRQIQLYMQGYWTIEQLGEKIRYNGNKSIQYYFATEKGLEYLKKVNECE